MSFFGKQFKKVKVENAAEFIAKLDLSELIRSLVRNPTSITTFVKNADGTIQYLVKNGEGQTVLDQKITLDTEADFTTPDGTATKINFSLAGDVIKSHIHLSDGKVVHMDRYFQANGMRLEMYLKGADDKATIYYEVV